MNMYWIYMCLDTSRKPTLYKISPYSKHCFCWFIIKQSVIKFHRNENAENEKQNLQMFIIQNIFGDSSCY